MRVRKFSLATGTFVMHSVENASKEMWNSNQDICWVGRNVDLHVYVHFPVHFKRVSLWILKKEKKNSLYKGMSVRLYFLDACSFVTKHASHSQLVLETCACCTWWLGLSVQGIITLASSCSEKVTSTDFLGSNFQNANRKTKLALREMKTSIWAKDK